MVIHIPKGPRRKTYAREDVFVQGDAPRHGAWMAPKPEPTQVPKCLPDSYPINLKPQTRLILAKALRKFPVRTRILKLCRYVVSELTPHFSAAVQNKTLRADQVEDTMNRLLEYIAIYNADTSEDQDWIEQEARRSSEWLKLSQEAARLAASAGKSHANSRSKRLSAQVHSRAAARKMESYLARKAIGLTEFAGLVGTTDRTLRSFRKTGSVRRDIFEDIAKAMGTTKEALLRSE